MQSWKIVDIQSPRNINTTQRRVLSCANFSISGDKHVDKLYFKTFTIIQQIINILSMEIVIYTSNGDYKGNVDYSNICLTNATADLMAH